MHKIRKILELKKEKTERQKIRDDLYAELASDQAFIARDEQEKKLQALEIRSGEECKEEPYDSEQTCYDIILCAYKRLLKSNIIALADNAKLLVAEYQQNNYKL